MNFFDKMAEAVTVRPQVEVQQWRSPFDFLGMAMCNMASISRMWNFQYLVFKNGGGVFIIPYMICFICLAAPLMIVEFTLGQFSKASPLTCWEFCPIFSGIGISMVIVSVVTSICYAMFITWTIFFLFSSFSSDVPWSKCGNWSTANCTDNVRFVHRHECIFQNGTAASNGLCLSHGEVGRTLVWDVKIALSKGFHRFSPAEEFFDRVVLGDGVHTIHNLGEMRIPIALILFLTWILVWLLLFKGIHLSAKFFVVSMVVPFAICIAFLVRGATLDGSAEGILFYLIPDGNAIFTLQIWSDAAFQVFITSATAFGGLVSLTRYNDFHYDIIGSIIFLSIANLVCNVIVGIMVFSYIGFLTKLKNTQIKNVIHTGPALALKVVPSAIAEISGTSFWGMAFFYMIICLSFGGQLVHVETVVSSILDFKPELKKQKIRLLSLVCLVFFILGLPLTTQGGQEVVSLLVTNAAGLNLIVIAVCECIAVGWVYGADRMIADMNYMIGRRCCGIYSFGKCSSIWLKVCWKIISPCLILFILLKPSMEIQTDYPLWGEILATMISFVAAVSVVGAACWQVYRAGGNFKERLKAVTTPSKNWSSAIIKHRQEIRQYMSDLLVYIEQQRASISEGDQDSSMWKIDRPTSKVTAETSELISEEMQSTKL